MSFFSYILLTSSCFQAISLFNANQHEEAMQRIQQLAVACPHVDALACRVVEVSTSYSIEFTLIYSHSFFQTSHQAYLHIQLGINALNDSYHDEAADHFTAAINTGMLMYNQVIRSQYEVFVVVRTYDLTENIFHAPTKCIVQLFGWDLSSSWKTAHLNRCNALLRAGMLVEAHEAYRHMWNIFDENTKASCLDWSTGKYPIKPSDHTHVYLKVSRKNAARSILRVVMLPSLQVNITVLSSYTLRRLNSILRLVLPLQAAVKRNWGRCYGKKHLMMRER